MTLCSAHDADSASEAASLGEKLKLGTEGEGVMTYCAPANRPENLALSFRLTLRARFFS